MLRCQALNVAWPGAGAAARPLRSSAARPQRCLVVAAAPPDGGSGQPPSSRRPASRLEPLPAAEQLGSSPRLEQQQLGGSQGAAPHASTHHGPHGAGAAAAAQHKAPHAPVEPGSWEDWQRYFYEMDDIVNELESLYTEQEEAVAREDYRAAAALKAQREVRQHRSRMSCLLPGSRCLLRWTSCCCVHLPARPDLICSVARVCARRLGSAAALPVC